MIIPKFWRKFRRNRAAIAGLALVAFFLLIAGMAPMLAPQDPFALSQQSLRPPSGAHLLGTDDLGRDILSGVLYGSRLSLAVGFLAAALSTLIGIIFGALAGYYGGRLDDFLMRISELFQVVPQFFLALTIVALLGPNITNIIVVIGVLSWPTTARLMRGQYLALRDREFVQAARSIGSKDLNIILREILPNAIPPVIINGSLQVARAILLEASLNFLGVGDPKIQSWGAMLLNAQRFLTSAWWMAFFPGMAIFFTVLGFNLLGDGLNDVLNPKSQYRSRVKAVE